MLYASAVNVVDITLIPAIIGTSRSSWCWLPLSAAPAPARITSGSTKLKNAAHGLRQNMRRSRRYWRQERAMVSLIACSLRGGQWGAPERIAGGRRRCLDIRGQLQVHVLERRPPDGQLLQALPARERLGGQLVQQRGGVVGLALHQRAVGAAVGDAVVRGAHAQLARRPDREHAALLDDRHAVGQRLRLVEVVGGQQDRLAERAQRADRLPRRPSRLGVEAGGGLVEEDQLGVAHQRQREVQAPQLPAGEPAAAHVGLLPQARQLQHLLDVARVRVEARPVAQRLARGDVAVDAARLQHDPDAPAQLDLPARGVIPEHRHLAAVARAVPLEDLHGRGLAGAVGPEQPEHLAAPHLDVDPAHGLVLAVALAQVAHLDRGAVAHGPNHRRRSARQTATCDGADGMYVWRSSARRNVATRRVGAMASVARSGDRLGQQRKRLDVRRADGGEVAVVSVASLSSPSRSTRANTEASTTPSGWPWY